MITGIDNATPIWDLSAARAEGYSFVMRYGPPSMYAMSMSECESIRSQGFGVGHVFEVQGDRALRGAQQGAADGRQHDAWADSCGAPGWVRLAYCAQDSGSITPAQLRGPVADYARAFNANCRRPTMPYGPYDAIEILCGELGISPYGWQTAGWSGSGAGSGGSFHCSDGSVRRLSKHTAMFQDVGDVLGGQADRNVVTNNVTPDWAWGGPYTGAKPNQEDDDMINWRPVHVPADPNIPGSGDAQWLLTWDGDGRPVRLFLGPGDGNLLPSDLWGLGWVQDTNPIVMTGEQGRKFMTLPEAVPTAPVTLDETQLDVVAGAVSDKLTEQVKAMLAEIEGDLTDTDVDLLVSKLLARMGSIRLKLELPA